MSATKKKRQMEWLIFQFQPRCIKDISLRLRGAEMARQRIDHHLDNMSAEFLYKTLLAIRHDVLCEPSLRAAAEFRKKFSNKKA